MRTARLLALFSLALCIVPARAQDTLSTTDTLAYTTTIVTVRAKPFVNAQSLGRVDAAAPVRLYTYVNSRGEWVPSPTRTPNDSAPVGASAHCRDGTYSFSRSRRGTCSHHGGVAEWLH